MLLGGTNLLNEYREIQDKFPAFALEYKHFCHRNAIRNVLCISGISDYEFLIKNTIDLTIAPTTEQRNIFYPAINNTRPVMNCIRNCFSDWLYDMAWDKINNELGKGNIILLNTDVYYLSYSEFYLKEHGSHIIILLRRKSDYYYVADWYEPQYFLGWMNKKDLAIARNSSNAYEKNHVYSGYAINCAWQKFSTKEFNGNYTKVELAYELLSDIFNRQNKKQQDDENKMQQYFCEIPKMVADNNVSNAQVVEDLFLLVSERKLCMRQLKLFGNEIDEINEICKELCGVLSEITNELQSLELIVLRNDLKHTLIDEAKWREHCLLMINKRKEFKNILSKKLKNEGKI